MISLLFIVSVTCLSIQINLSLSPTVTWFTYYMGGVVGLLISSSILDLWTKWHRDEA